MVDFSQAEREIQSHFAIGTQVFFQNEYFTVNKVGKPTCLKGEPKTDIYILLKNDNNTIEIKISYKKDNADFLENKIKAERAEQVFGSDWREIIQNSTHSISHKFLEKPLIYKEALNRTQKGSITLGWKFELVNKSGGDLSGKLLLSHQQLLNIYAGSNLSEDKRNALVNNEKITNSGIADYILFGNQFNSAEEILDQMISIVDYIKEHPTIYFACKALNFRTFENKSDGDRPLAVQIKWKNINNKLIPEFIFDQPLEWNGNAVKANLLECLKQLNIKTTDDINEHNAEFKYLYQ